MSCTDGTMICRLCGEWRTGCGLCNDVAPLVPNPELTARKFEHDPEIAQQEQCIAYAAAKRAGFI